MNKATLATFSAKDAEARFGELLDTAMGHPVGITKHDRVTAYVISKAEYEMMVEKLQELEDQLWLLKADAARKEGFVDSQDVDAVLGKLGDLVDEEAKNN